MGASWLTEFSGNLSRIVIYPTVVHCPLGEQGDKPEEFLVVLIPNPYMAWFDVAVGKVD